MIEIKGFTKIYNKTKKAVDNISLTIEDGEIFGFIGHNGAGKTTTIKAIVGILDFEEGDILINGKSIKERPIECKKEIAYIPDNPDLYDTLTGISFINFMCDIYEVPKSERKSRINEYATKFNLLDNLGDEISSYSHGMKQKLALIAALVHKPKVLVLDEPFVALDPKAVFDLKELMNNMCREGVTIFFSTHILDVAEKLCNRVAIIKEGRLVKVGKMEEVKGDKSLENVFLDIDKQEE
ncbi:MAG: ABC transporter ATP-binding protein [Clostridia bacterium]|nr:ABC transporter ATP-binding protein [Clostridia bacterium]MDD4375481.1 ABC transporter ATP-binding protein [Clostridia bacterium]